MTQAPDPKTNAGEVGDGVTSFQPSPSECRALVSQRYSVGRTLLCRFVDDGIDETRDLEGLLRPRFVAAGMSTLVLPGTHVTPCGGDLPAESIAALPPAAAAVASLVRDGAQGDLRRLGSRVVGWLDSVTVGM
ncbi:hypothetical protein FOA52_004048 [Chlamydomonas sp. UWO 241]|nr:hypothetical protein FOA52_004048 [Chlamydomonas sp. UWO 241]